MYIEGYCCTNLDEFRNEKWPVVFVAVPRLGERVRSESRIELRVCSITYISRQGKPEIEVELNK